ncbi:hypothetical protein JCM16303_001750 [Sporobolomyces ruberrimus]
MATSRPPRSTSIDSHDMVGDSDLEHDDGMMSQAGPSRRKGKGKATKETDRKAQNRIAQREFRQRKQAYIKELEAKVKLQELGRDEQTERLADAVRILLEENEHLRQLLAGLSGFIGEGLGGALPRLRTTLPEFQTLLSRTQIDTATGALRLDELGISSSSRTNGTRTQKGDFEPSPPLPPAHPANTSGYSHDDYSEPSRGPPLPQTSAPPPSHAQPLRSSSGPASYPSTSRAQSQSGPRPPLYSLQTEAARCVHKHFSIARSASNENGEGIGGEGEGQCCDDEGFPEWYLGQIHRGNLDAMEAAEDELIRAGSLPTSNNVLQAMQLISYHMKSKREHPDYILPPSLKATPTQTLVPHSPIFDGIIFPSMRDRLILLKDQYPLVELTKDLIGAITIHGNDLLSQENWELSKHFLQKYWFVIDETVLEISNKWRKERGEPLLDMKSIVPDME